MHAGIIKKTVADMDLSNMCETFTDEFVRFPCPSNITKYKLELLLPYFLVILLINSYGVINLKWLCWHENFENAEL